MQGRMSTVSLHLDNTIEHDRHIWIINSIKEINCTLNTPTLRLISYSGELNNGCTFKTGATCSVFFLI